MQKHDIERWNCTRCNDTAAPFQLQKLVHIKSWDVTAFVGFMPPLDAAVVAFRGTDSHNFGNWLDNLDVLRQPYHKLPFPGAQ